MAPVVKAETGTADLAATVEIAVRVAKAATAASAASATTATMGLRPSSRRHF